MAADIKALQAKMMKDNFEKYASEGEKRTQATLKNLEGASAKLSDTGKAYLEMLTKTVEATSGMSAKQLSYATERIKEFSQNISTASDLTKNEQELLQQQVEAVSKQMNESSKNSKGLLKLAGETFKENAVDMTSIVAGLTSNNPIAMFAVKWIGDTIKQRKEEQAEAQRQVDEAMASIDTSNVGGGESGVGDQIVTELQKQNAFFEEQINLDKANDDREEAKSGAQEEERRERERYNEDTLEALQGIEGNLAKSGLEKAGSSESGGGGFMDAIMGIFAGKGLSGLLGFVKGIPAMVGNLVGSFGTAISSAISTAGPIVARALPIASIAVGAGMIIKDGWDMASAALDDDIATEIEGQDIGGVAGGAIGGAIGFALGGPIGAGIGMMVGNFIGEAIGDAMDPNTSELLSKNQNQIADKQTAIVETYNQLEQAFNDGLISEQEWLAAKSELDKEINEINQLSLESQRVEELERARQAAANNYNNLDAQIKAMEEAGTAVPQAMYDQLEQARQNFEVADEAFDQAAIELNAKIDPTWWDTLKAGVVGAVDSVHSGLTAAKDWVSTTATDMGNAIYGKVDEMTGGALTGAAEYIGNLIDDVTAGAEAYWNSFKDKMSETWADIKGFFGFGDDAEIEGDRPLSELSDEELIQREQEQGRVARTTERTASISERAMAQGSFQMSRNGVELTDEEKRVEIQSRRDTADAERADLEAIEAERDRRAQLRREAEDTAYREREEEIARLQEAVAKDTFGSVGWSSDDEKERIAELQAQNANLEQSRLAEANTRYNNQRVMFDAGFGDTEPVAPTSGRDYIGPGRAREFQNADDPEAQVFVEPMRPQTGRALNATQADTEQARQEASAANNIVVAPTTTNVQNNSQTTQQVAPPVSVRNQSDDYRSYGFQ